MVASRREAMMRKRQLFYFSPDANGEYCVREGRVVQARVIAVADKSIRVEIFGVECSIMARDLAWTDNSSCGVLFTSVMRTRIWSPTAKRSWASPIQSHARSRAMMRKRQLSLPDVVFAPSLSDPAQLVGSHQLLEVVHTLPAHSSAL